MIRDGPDAVAGQHRETCPLHQCDDLIMIEAAGSAKVRRASAMWPPSA
jgi:hypothetical protein